MRKEQIIVKLYVISICTFLLFNVSAYSTTLSAAKPANIGAREAASFQFKSFREWKLGMIYSAEMQLKQSTGAIALKQRLSASADPNLAAKNTAESGLNPHLVELQKQAEKDKYQLAITRDLTISDYFVGYLTKQKDMAAAISEVSGRLSPEEIAELMAAYANNFFSSKSSMDTVPVRSGFNR